MQYAEVGSWRLWMSSLDDRGILDFEVAWLVGAVLPQMLVRLDASDRNPDRLPANDAIFNKVQYVSVGISGLPLMFDPTLDHQREMTTEFLEGFSLGRGHQYELVSIGFSADAWPMFARWFGILASDLLSVPELMNDQSRVSSVLRKFALARKNELDLPPASGGVNP